MDGERESKESTLSAYIDDDDDNQFLFAVLIYFIYLNRFIYSYRRPVKVSDKNSYRIYAKTRISFSECTVFFFDVKSLNNFPANNL